MTRQAIGLSLARKVGQALSAENTSNASFAQSAIVQPGDFSHAHILG